MLVWTKLLPGELVNTITQQRFHLDSPNFHDSFRDIIVSDKAVKTVSKQGFQIDSPNLQDSCNMASPRMVLHMDRIGQHLPAC